MTDSDSDRLSLHTVAWKRSSHSANGPHPQCVEAAIIGNHIGLRDGKCHRFGVLSVPVDEWRCLVATLRQ